MAAKLIGYGFPSVQDDEAAISSILTRTFGQHPRTSRHTAVITMALLETMDAVFHERGVALIQDGETPVRRFGIFLRGEFQGTVRTRKELHRWICWQIILRLRELGTDRRVVVLGVRGGGAPPETIRDTPYTDAAYRNELQIADAHNRMHRGAIGSTKLRVEVRYW